MSPGPPNDEELREPPARDDPRVPVAAAHHVDTREAQDIAEREIARVRGT